MSVSSHELVETRNHNGIARKSGNLTEVVILSLDLNCKYIL